MVKQRQQDLGLFLRLDQMTKPNLKVALEACLLKAQGKSWQNLEGLNVPLFERAIRLSYGSKTVSEQWMFRNLQSIFSKVRFESEEVRPAFLHPSFLKLELEMPTREASGNFPNLDDLHQQVKSAKGLQEAVNLIEYHLSNVAIAPELSHVGAAKLFRSILALYGSLGADEELYLVGADLSGVQSYLYNIISTGASNNLKGRSFYLQLLTENCLELFLQLADLPAVHTVYNSGGSFYVLGSATERISQSINDFRNQVEESLFKEHATDLFMAIEAQAFKGRDLESENAVSDIWQALSEKLSKAKGQRYHNLISVDFDEVFKVREVNSNRLDAITGEVIGPEDATLKLKLGSSEEERFVLKKNAAQIDLAKNLNRAEYWNISLGSSRDDRSFDRPGLGFVNYFKSRKEGRNLRLNVPSPEEEWFLLGGNSYPHDEDGNPLTFDKLVEHPEQEGIGRLGVLRMDVDNLGMLFKSGLGAQASLAAFAELSFRLDQFFKGHLNVLRDKSKLRRESTYIVYSGGDDLFLLGQWSELLDFATDIQSDFQAWTAQHPSISISGGLVMVRPRYPISKAAEIAGAYESQSKSFIHPISGKAKSAFTLFGIPFAWSEINEIHYWRDFWLESLRQKAVAHGFLHRLYQFRAQKNSEGSQRFSWQWNASYLLARQRKDKRITEQAYQELLRLIVNGAGNYRSLDLACVGARWAELKTR